MTKLIIFDMDGVLIDAKEIHYESLNLALGEVGQKYVISRDEHISTYDGLPTKAKLSMLTEKKGLPIERYEEIWINKQKMTVDLLKKNLKFDERLVSVLKSLKEDGYTIYVASNSVRETIKIALLKTGLIEFVDYYMSNEDVRFPKPNAEIYLRCMAHAGVSPKETIIIEDSIHGRQAALDSGASLCAVDSVDDVTYERIIDELTNTRKKKNKWASKDLTVLIPMAGAGSRFATAGYSFPKPLIEVRNKPMIQVVVDNLNVDCKFVYIVQRSHYEKYNLNYLLNLITPGCEIVQVEGVTEGAACTTLLAKEYYDNENPLLIANSDQFIEWDSHNFFYTCGEKIDGLILTFESTHPKWSFVREEDGKIVEIAEKKPISNIATVGIYFWKRGCDYVRYAEKMIRDGKRVNGEFYVAPVYNDAIEDGLTIKKFNISKMWGIGTPEDLGYFLENYKDSL